MVNTVVDFTGFDFEGHYIIKEFVVARILDNLIEVEDQILIDITELPIDSGALFYDSEFFAFYNKTHIIWGKRSDHTRKDIIAKMKSLRHHNIYVRDKIYAVILANYLKVSPNSFNSLSDITDFDPDNRIMKTNCRNHQSRQSYCVKNNVMIMAEWLKEKLKEFPEPKERLAVIDYAGYLEDTTKNIVITILRVHCFDNNGTVTYDKLLFSTTFNSMRNTSVEEFERHKERYREKYGIDYTQSNVHNLAIINQLKKILLENKIEFIFVETNITKNHLLGLLGLSFNISNLGDYGYVNVHTNTNVDDYLKKSIHQMVDFVTRKKLNTSVEEFERHKERYREKYGINYTQSNFQNLAIINQLKKILFDNKIKFNFVENSIQKEDLLGSLDSSFNIFNFDSYGYVEDKDNDDNLEKDWKRMVDFVIRKKLYVIIRQQNEIIDVSDDESIE
ncbi:hypothetical protein KQX54_014190 [Cotesia glomerata]|uniref:Uncharacterized protein n=1 Tax=Cotesia glomerata TaxID=32391 RepID=A0AAV7IS07_COTGL|nr:hypothetical protein KQX54_014190 [Cotesia glomerata]